MNQIYHDDLFNVLPAVQEKSIDLILCDLPYGTTQCKWDCRIDLTKLWEQLWRVAKANCPIIMFSSQPFTSTLLVSQIDKFKYEWIWEKSKASNFLDAKKKPLKSHESLLVFCNGKTPYYPQMTNGSSYKAKPGKKITEVYGAVRDSQFRNDNNGVRYPRSIIYFKTAESEGKPVHPTQKPIDHCRYIIRTYTKEGDLVLDPCIGSGTTAIACLRENRNYIGVEKDDAYFNACGERIKAENRTRSQTGL
jgi:site-specific DNA-methyltransferase (adenine-specific)